MGDDDLRSYWLSRTMCDSLNELRRMIKELEKMNIPIGMMLFLVEEIQSVGNRMETGLQQQKDLLAMDEEWHRLRREIKELRKEKKILSGDKNKPNDLEPCSYDHAVL